MTTAPVRPDITALANAAGRDRGAADALLAAVYDHLRGMAKRQVAGDRAGRSLGATSLVHTVYGRLFLGSGGEPEVPDRPERWHDRRHFFRAFGEAMRVALIDHARHGGRQKRGGGRTRVDLGAASVVDLAARGDAADVVAMEAAVGRLRAALPEAYEVVLLKFYSGLTTDQAAAALGCSDKTVKRRWALARSYLFDALGGTAAAHGSDREDA